jgi:hypothetical protein
VLRAHFLTVIQQHTIKEDAQYRYVVSTKYGRHWVPWNLRHLVKEFDWRAYSQYSGCGYV